MIEKMFTTGPYLELFGRELVKGWHVFGNDPKLWSGQQEGG
jgi:N6-adenosine-specific RNA methylase IME4